MGRLAKQKRILIEEANKRLLGESYEGIIKKGDKPCDIWCKNKIAKYGSTGDVVKMIQHYLAKGAVDLVKKTYGPYNPEKEGGGMIEGCAKNWRNCDGLFQSETKKAVEDFQIDAKVTKDGVVGYNTLKKICDLLGDKETTLCEECKCNEKENTNTNTKKSYNINDVNNGCDSLQSCLEQLFEKKDLISRDDYIQCLEKGGNKNTKKWSCENCPDTFNFLRTPNKENLSKDKIDWCSKNCGTRVVH